MADPQRISELKENGQAIRQRIDDACRENGRDPQDVKLIWVSKTKPIEDVEAAWAAGARDFGENRVQEAVDKFSGEPRPDTELHIIGPVQSNKMRQAVQRAQWIHSVSRLKDVNRLQRICEEENRTLKVLFQVNTSGEESKSGIPQENAREFFELLPECPNLLYCGLMTIGPFTGNPADARPGFQYLRELRQELLDSQEKKFAGMQHLSMGMTDDLEIAVAEGATMVRVGTALFGARMQRG